MYVVAVELNKVTPLLPKTEANDPLPELKVKVSCINPEPASRSAKV